MFLVMCFSMQKEEKKIMSFKGEKKKKTIERRTRRKWKKERKKEKEKEMRFKMNEEKKINWEIEQLE